jgi:hypothetical protein
LRRHLSLVVACLAAVALVACGEKEEPDFSGPGAQPKADPLAPVAGTWSGTLEQQGMKPFTVRVTIASAQAPAQNPVRYTGLNCSGSWDFQSREGAGYHFREVIDRGTSPECKGVGDVTVTPRGSRLAYRFTGGGVTSTGLLSRTG